MTATVTADQSRRYAAVDVMRALAALSIVVYHVGVIPRPTPAAPFGSYRNALSVGVPLFFVISGFLLYRQFVVARQTARAVSVRTYAWRRALRILPAYWVALTVLTVAFHLPGVFSADWWRYYGLLQIYDLRTFDGGMGVAWTLCIEATFYVLLPLYAAAVRWLAGRMRDGAAEAVGLGSLVVVSVAVNAFVVLGGHDVRAARNLAGTVDWFAAGMAVAWLSASTVRVVRPRVAWPLAAVAFVGLAQVASSSWRPSVLAGHFVAVVVAGLVMLPMAGRVDAGRRSWSRVLAFIGTVSYSVYLYHATLIPPLVKRGALTWVPGSRWVSLLVPAVLLAVAVATVSFFAVERPFMRMSHKRRVVAVERDRLPVNDARATI